MRSSITLFEDQYQFFKELKSKKLLVAFVEYMFEDIEPEGLNGIEKTIFNSMRNRMENSKKIHDRNSKGGQQSHGGGRKGNTSSELEGKNSLKTAKEQQKEQPKNNEEEEEEEVYKENVKRKYLDYVYLSDDEYKKISDRYGERVLKEFITRLNNWIGEKPKSKDRRDRNAYYTILSWIRKDGIKELPPKPLENETGIYDLPF